MGSLSLESITPSLVAAGTEVARVLLRLALVFGAGYAATRFVRTAAGRIETALIRAGEPTEPTPGATRKRVTTLTSMIRTLVIGTLWAVVIVIALDQVGLDITPIIAGAGIIGLAVGFGAQNLVRDLISGFFIVLENQVRVGDVAIINGTGGLVEAVTFRVIVLRDLSGVVHVFPNGTITTLSNMTHGWSAYVIDVGVAYKEDTDRVVAVMHEVGEEMRADPAFTHRMLQPIEIFGVDDFGDSAVIVKARLKTQPIEQWNVGREYRRRLKKAFDARGIEIPFPHRSIYMGEVSAPFRIQLEDGQRASAS